MIPPVAAPENDERGVKGKGKGKGVQEEEEEEEEGEDNPFRFEEGALNKVRENVEPEAEADDDDSCIVSVPVVAV